MSMPGSYSPLLVAVSLAVAVLASYTTLNVAERIRSIAVSAEKRRYWRLGGAAAMGTGIWSMHFIGMLALQMPMEIGYDPALTALSLVFAVGVSWFALLTVTGSELTHRRLATGGCLMGLGVAAMHYTGMAAMRMSPGCTTVRGCSSSPSGWRLWPRGQLCGSPLRCAEMAGARGGCGRRQAWRWEWRLRECITQAWPPR
jgi:Bacterial signalling protein N terminal repeat